MAIYGLWDSHMHKKGKTVPPRQRHRQPRTWGPGRSTGKLSARGHQSSQLSVLVAFQHAINLKNLLIRLFHIVFCVSLQTWRVYLN